MSWSYSGDPSQSTLDQVRFLIGDTDDTDPQLSNEEIQFQIAQHESPELAGAHCCEVLSAKFARLVTKSVGSLSIQFSELQDHYKSLKEQLYAHAGADKVPPYCGGLLVSDKEANEIADDVVQPAFRVGMHNFSHVQDITIAQERSDTD